MHPSLSCPACHSQLSSNLVCVCGQNYTSSDHVIRLLSGHTGRQIRAFANLTSAIRRAEGKQIISPVDYRFLPELPRGIISHEWRLRQHDLVIIRQLLRGHSNLAILDIGAWNGWLSQCLGRLGHCVTGADYFDDALDGLGAIQYSHTPWRAVQCDLTRPGLLGYYDLIILNRCLQFFPDPIGYIHSAYTQLKAGGMLVLLGLQIFSNPRQKEHQIQELQAEYRQKYGFELFLRPTKGYLDTGDFRQLVREGITFYPYIVRGNLHAMLNVTRPLHVYGVIRVPES